LQRTRTENLKRFGLMSLGDKALKDHPDALSPEALGHINNRKSGKISISCPYIELFWQGNPTV